MEKIRSNNFPPIPTNCNINCKKNGRNWWYVKAILNKYVDLIWYLRKILIQNIYIYLKILFFF